MYYIAVIPMYLQLIAVEKHVYTLRAQAQISSINRTGIIALHPGGFQ